MEKSKAAKKTLVLFPKGPIIVKGIFEIAFDKVMPRKNSVIARYSVIPKKKNEYKEMVSRLKPFMGKNFCIIPGMRSSFVVPKETDCLEYAIAIDYDRANAYFNSAKELKVSTPSIMSDNIIKGLIKSHLAKTVGEL